MRIFITGASGFIGANLIKSLIRNGHELLCLTKTKSNLIISKQLKILIGDLNDCLVFEEDLKKFNPEAVIHLAWSGLPNYSFLNGKNNLLMSLDLIDLLSRLKVSKILIAGSCWEYGDSIGEVSEINNSTNLSLFAEFKCSLYNLSKAIISNTNIKLYWARIFYCYGPGQKSVSLIPTIWRHFKKNQELNIKTPEQFQDFIYIDDVTEALKELIESNAPNGIYNIGSSTATSVGEIVNRIAEYYQMDRYYKLDLKVNGFWANISKIQTHTKWIPKVNIYDGLRNTLIYFDSKS